MKDSEDTRLDNWILINMLRDFDYSEQYLRISYSLV